MNAPLRARLNRPLIGTFLKSASYQNAEILGLGGLDYLVLDAEHAPFGDGDIDLIALAARSVHTPLLVRVSRTDPSFINTCLDLGAEGILVPHIRSAEDAAQAVAAAHYHGTRGFSPSPRAAGYGTLGMRRHLADSGHRTTVWAQIEDAAALAHLDAIAGTDGIDCLFVGRADLALSLGLDSPDHPDITALLQDIAAAATRGHCAAGIFVNDADDMAERAREGYTCFVFGSDQSLLMQQAKWLKTTAAAL